MCALNSSDINSLIFILISLLTTLSLACSRGLTMRGEEKFSLEWRLPRRRAKVFAVDKWYFDKGLSNHDYIKKSSRRS